VKQRGLKKTCQTTEGVSLVVSTWALEFSFFHFLLIFRVILVKKKKKSIHRIVERIPYNYEELVLNIQECSKNFQLPVFKD